MRGPWIVVALLALLSLGLLMFVFLGGSGDVAPVAPPQESGVRQTAENSLPLFPDNASRVAEPVVAPANATATTAPERSRPEGSSRLRFVDAHSHEPVGGLEFELFTERPSLRRIAVGTADASGHAVVDDPDEELIVVETVRRPPYAKSFRAIWLAEESERDWIVEVSGGGRISGRVVDEAGEPARGVEVRLDAEQLSRFDGVIHRNEPSLLTLTDAAGEFAFDAVASLPTGIWYVEGGARPESWLPVRVQAAGQTRAAQVGNGAELRVEDFVVPRARVYAGIVLDRDGARVPGALVSIHRWRGSATDPVRRATPGQPGFRLFESETLTDELGVFTLAVRSRARTLVAQAPGGLAEEFPIDPLEGGERRDGLELRLTAERVFTAELVDGTGERIVLPTPGFVGFLPQLPAFAGLRAEQARFRFADEHGAWHTVEVGCQGDGLLRFDLPLALEEIRELVLLVKGFQPLRLPASDWASLDLRATFRLEPLPRLSLRLLAPANAPSGAMLEVRACALSSETLASAAENGDSICCGLGCTAFASDLEPGGSAVLALPVLDRRPFTVLVESPLDPFGETLVAGPFRPGGETHEVQLAGSLFSGGIDLLGGPVGLGAAPVSPPPVIAPEDVPVDEAPAPPPTRSRASARPPADPPPTLVVQLVDSADRPLTGRAQVRGLYLQDESVCKFTFLLSQGSGRFATREKLPQHLLLLVQRLGTPTEFHRAEIDRWTPGEPVRLPLGPAAEVRAIVRVAPELRYSALKLTVEPDVTPFHESSSWQATELPPDEDGTRVFTWRLGAGSYRVEGTSAHFAITPREFRVDGDRGVVELELEATKPL